MTRLADRWRREWTQLRHALLLVWADQRHWWRGSDRLAVGVREDVGE